MQKQITLNEYEFSVEEVGAGEIIILVHGSASDRRIWTQPAEDLSSDFHVISYSRRFHWPNQKIAPGEDYSMRQHVDDLKSLVKYFSDGPVHLVGHSYGALVCLELAVQHPELIRKMVLAEPPAIRLFVSNRPKSGEMLKLLFRRPKTAFAIIKLGATGLGPATKAAEKGDMEKAMELFGKAALGKGKYEKMTADTKEKILENLTASEFTGSGFLPINEKKLKELQVPVLLLTGEKSRKFYAYLKDRLMELLPDSTHSEIPAASHIMQQDNPEAFNRAVKSFLKGK